MIAGIGKAGNPDIIKAAGLPQCPVFINQSYYVVYQEYYR